jgi:subtilisin family serine protease
MKNGRNINGILWAGVLVLAALAWILKDKPGTIPKPTGGESQGHHPPSLEKPLQGSGEPTVWEADPVEEFDFLESPGNDFDGGDLLLGFEEQDALEKFLKTASENNITILDSNRALGLARVSISNLRDLAKLANALPENLEIQRNFPVYAPAPAFPVEDGSPRRFGDEALKWMGVPEDNTDWGKRQIVAILDTGVWTDHEAFTNAKIKQIDLLSPEQSVPGDYDGHGTAVASLIVANSPTLKGIAPSTELLSLRVLDGEGKGDTFTVANGIVEAVKHGAKVISLSLGSHEDNYALRKAVNYALANGAILVASAGNDSAARISFPAAYPEVLGVTSIDAGSRLAEFSNIGDGVELAAPGVGLSSAWIDGKEVSFSGTSASAPLVAGAIAGILSNEPQLTPKDALALLVENANDGYAIGKDPRVGNGVINLERVLARNQPGIYDIAVGGYYFSPLVSPNSSKSFDIIIQNRGTEWLSGSTLALTVGTQAKRFRMGSMKPGESLKAEYFLTPEQILDPNGTLIQAKVQANAREDSRPDNNSWSTRMVFPADK